MAATHVVRFPIKGPHGVASSWTLDQGVDITAPGGTPLVAVENGTVTYRDVSGFTNGQATMPVLTGDSGAHYYYGHALHPKCRQGQRVVAGQEIAVVGEGRVGMSTGPHLEFGLCNAFGIPLGPQTARDVQAALLNVANQGPYAPAAPPINAPVGPVSVGGTPLTGPVTAGERLWDYSPAVRSSAKAQAGHGHVLEVAAQNVLSKLARWRLPR